MDKKVICKTINELRIQGLFCDLTIKSNDGIKISVHKNIMYFASLYFRNLLSSELEENENVVELQIANGAILEKLISYIYTGNFEAANAEEFLEISKCANSLQIIKLTKLCKLRLNDFIDEKTCLTFWRTAKGKLMNEIEDSIVSYILKRAKTLFQDPSFLYNLTTVEMKRLLEDDHLACDEESTFEAVMRWAKDKTSNDDEFLKMFTDVVDYIRFPLLSEKFIISHVMDNDTFMDDKKMLKKFAEYNIFKFKKMPIKSTMLRIGSVQKRFLAICDTKILSVCDEENLSHFETNVTLNSQFEYCAYRNNFLLACCGEKYSKSSMYFSTTTKEWKRFPALPLETLTIGHQCICFDDKIYVCGGWYFHREYIDMSIRSLEFPNSQIDYSKRVAIFDLNLWKWSIGPEMNFKRSDFGLTTLNQSLYAVGGLGNQSVEMLDLRLSNEWKKIYEGFPFNEHTRCASIGTDIYCFCKFKHPFIFDTRMNNYRLWRSDALSFFEEDLKNFYVCELDNEIGIYCLYDNLNELRKYNTKGEVTLQGMSSSIGNSSVSGGLVAVYY